MSRPQDVVELILKDHQMTEDLLTQMRHPQTDRIRALQEFADLYIAHVSAEQDEVYTALLGHIGIDDVLLECGIASHREIKRALLRLLEAEEGAPYAWDARLDELTGVVLEHVRAEEATLLPRARHHVPEGRRVQLGAAYAEERAAQLRACCGGIDNVRRMAWARPRSAV